MVGVGAPKKTPTEIVEKLNKDINAALANPKLQARFADLGGTVLPGSPADFGKLDNHDQEPWKLPLPEFIRKLYSKRF